MMDEKKQELNDQLFDAIKERNASAITKLLGEGADPNYKDDKGNTSLHDAVFSKAPPEVFNALLAGGADLTAENRYGQTPSMLAEDSQQKETQSLLSSASVATLVSANNELLSNLPENDRPHAAAEMEKLENAVATQLKVDPETRGMLSNAQRNRNSNDAVVNELPSDSESAGIINGIKETTTAVQNGSLAPHQASTGIAAVNNQFDNANKEAARLSGDSTIKQGGAKSEASKSKAPPSKTQQFFQDIGNSLNSKLKSNLAQGKRDLLAIPILGPILGAVFKAIRNSIDAKKREQAAEARAAKEAKISQDVAGQPPAQDQANAAKATVSTSTDATAADAKAPQQTMTNKHGNVTVTPGKPDKLSAKSPEALMQAVKDKDYKSFTITSGSPEQSLKAMQHGLEIGVPNVKLSEAQEKKITDLKTDTGNKKLDAKNQKLKDDYQEVKTKYEAKLQTTNQSTASLGGAGSTVPAATPATATPAADVPRPTKPLPPEPGTLTASTTTPTNAAAQTGAAPIAAPKRDLPTPPQQWTKESWAELKQAKGKDDKDTKGSDNAKGAVLSKAMSSGNSVSKDSIKALKDSMGPEAFTRVAIVALTTTPTPKPTPQANNQNTKEEKPKEEKATRAAQKQSNVNALMQNLTPAQLIVVVDAVSKNDNKKSQKSLERMDNNKEEWKKDHPKDQGAKPSASAATAKKYGAPPLFVKALEIVDKLVDKAQEKRAATSDKSNKSDKENAGPANKQSTDSSKTEDKKANASSKSSKSAGGFAAQAGAPPLIQKAIELIEKKVTESKEKQQEKKQQNSSSNTQSQQPKK